MFEGYKVPECTEEEVRVAIRAGYCAISPCSLRGCCISRKCVLSDSAREHGVTQRYHDHRWPKDKKTDKVAVHCPTQELWDRVQEKMGIDKYTLSDRTFVKEGVYLYVDSGLWDYKEKVEADKGYKIISAVEYLGEESIIFTYGAKSNSDVSASITWHIIDDKEEDMNASTVRTYMVVVYEGDVEKALLVDRHFGGALEQTFDCGFTRTLWLTDKKAEYLAEAQRLEEEEAKDKE